MTTYKYYKDGFSKEFTSVKKWSRLVGWSKTHDITPEIMTLEDKFGKIGEAPITDQLETENFIAIVCKHVIKEFKVRKTLQNKDFLLTHRYDPCTKTIVPCSEDYFNLDVNLMECESDEELAEKYPFDSSKVSDEPITYYSKDLKITEENYPLIHFNFNTLEMLKTDGVKRFDQKIKDGTITKSEYLIWYKCYFYQVHHNLPLFTFDSIALDILDKTGLHIQALKKELRAWANLEREFPKGTDEFDFMTSRIK